MRSSVPAFKKAFTARLEAVPRMIGAVTTVSNGDPYPKRATAELVAIGQVSNRKVEYRGAMSQGRETYDIEVIISVIAASSMSNTHEAMQDVAYDLAAEVVSSALLWRETGYDGVCDIITEGLGSDDGNRDETGLEASVTLSFHVTATI